MGAISSHDPETDIVCLIVAVPLAGYLIAQILRLPPSLWMSKSG
jgi:hypothetical protein